MTGLRLQRGLMLAPVAVGVLALVVLPALATFALALFSYDGFTSPEFVGFDNLRRMRDDALLHDAVRASLVFVALAVPLRLAVALGLALMLHRRARGAALGRTAGFVPTVVPDAAQALLWAWLLNPLFGPVNAVIGALGLPRPDWYASGSGAMATFVVIAAFTAGEAFVVALAARREIPRELEEAARLDGASAWHFTRRVTLPLMAPVLGLLACRDLAVSLQATFAAGYLITDGGPARATLFLPVYVYDLAFEQFQYGYAAAVTLALYLLTAAAILAGYVLFRRAGAARVRRA